MFDFYLRTNKLLEIKMVQTGYQEYAISAPNLPMALPIDVLTDGGTKKIILTAKCVTIKSSFPPVVDPNGYYLQAVSRN